MWIREAQWNELISRLARLEHQGNAIMTGLTDLQAAVAANAAAITSAVNDINSLAAQLAAAAKAPPGDSDADVEALAQQLQTATAALTVAVSSAPAPATPASPAA